jgi:hypothetical protein
MDYALGSFAPDRDAALTALVQQLGLLSPSDLAARLRAFHGAPPADVLDVLATSHPDRAWLAQVSATADELVADGHDLALLVCRHEDDGSCVVAFHDRALLADVRPGDSVQAGAVVLRGAGPGLSVAPRVFRKVCSNGAVLELPGAEAQAIDAADVGAALRACLQAEPFAEHVRQLRHAAFELVVDGPALLRAAALHTPDELLLGRWRRQGDRSLWGLVNAATSLAHADPLWHDRVTRERDASRLLAVGLARSSAVVASLASLR